MVTLSVTRSRIAAVLRDAALLLETEGWEPLRQTIADAIDRAAGFVKPGVDPAAEEVTLQAWEALAAHLHWRLVESWERTPGRTEADVLAALRGAADEVVA